MASKYIVTSLSVGVLVCAVILFWTAECDAQFVGGKMTFTISGNAGVPLVEMTGFPEKVTTDASGSYSVTVEYGWRGTVKPVKLGYTFTPETTSYTKVTASQVNQDYAATELTYTITGKAGMPGVTMTGLPGDPVTDDKGVYTATVRWGFTGTAVPTLTGYDFTPTRKPYNNVVMDMKAQDYTAKKKKYTIIGSTGTPAVTLEGFPGNPVSKPDGTYSITLEHGTTVTVTPKKAGYQFVPDQLTFTELADNLSAQDFTAQILQYTISGNVGVPLAVLKGLGENIISDADGFYSAVVDYGFTGTVTPQKEGYNFEPATTTYSKVIADATQDYTSAIIQLKITGSTGVPGAMMVGLPGDPVCDEQGNFEAMVDYGWTGVVSPELEGYLFTPPMKQYTDEVKTDQLAQNFPGKQLRFPISGSTGLANVTLKGFPSTSPVISTGDGSYTADVPYGWTGTITPEKAGYDFQPATYDYDAVKVAQDNQSFNATLQSRTIAGTILDKKGQPVSEVTVSSGLGGALAQTDTAGKYEITVQYGWTGQLVAYKEGYNFEPSKMNYTALKEDKLNQSYVAELIMLKMSGTIIIGGTPIDDILVSADNGGGSATTDKKGYYSLEVPYGWSGKVTPTKEGWEFNPPYKEFVSVTVDHVNGEPKAQRSATQGMPPLQQTSQQIPPLQQTPPDGQLPRSEDFPPPGQTTSTGGRLPSIDDIPPPGQGEMQIDPSMTEAEIQQLLQQQRIAQMQEEIARLQAGGAVDPSATGMPPGQGPTQGPSIQDTYNPMFPEHAKPVSADFVNEDLLTALQILGQKAGVDIYPDDTVKRGKKRVTMSFRNEPLGRAIQKLLAKDGTGYIAKEVPNSFLVFAPITNLWDETDLYIVLQDISMEVGVPIVADEQVVGTVTAQVDGVSLDTALDIVLAGTNYVIKKTDNYYLVTTADIKSPYLFEDVSETRRVKLNYSDAAAAVQMLSSAYMQYAKPDPTTNSVLVTAPSDLTERIVADLKLTDERPKHILLDARVVVMESGDLLNMGVEWTWPNIAVGTYGQDLHTQGELVAAGDPDGKDWPWGVQIGYTPGGEFTGALELALSLLQQNGEVAILSTPQVLAQDGKQAEISVMSEQYFYLTAQNQSAFYLNSQLEKVEAGTKLTITPTISDEGEITLDISVEVSNILTTARETGLPVISRRIATNTVRVKDGGTAAVAGLTETSSRYDYRKTPFFSNLPLVGKLFDYESEATNSQEVAVFITAYLIPDAPGGDTPLPEPARMGPVDDVTKSEFEQSIRESLSRLSQQ